MWKTLHAVSQEQMTRLRVSAVFYKSVDEHCAKLEQLKESVKKLKDVPERERKINKLRKYLAVREALLVEIGRMVRLGRLLKTRLKEPFVLYSDLERSVLFFLHTCQIFFLSSLSLSLNSIRNLKQRALRVNFLLVKHVVKFIIYIFVTLFAHKQKAV
jgi:hypothetical protein